MSLSQETDSSKEDGAEEGGQFLSKAFAIVLIFWRWNFFPLSIASFWRFPPE